MAHLFVLTCLLVKNRVFLTPTCKQFILACQHTSISPLYEHLKDWLQNMQRQLAIDTNQRAKVGEDYHDKVLTVEELCE